MADQMFGCRSRVIVLQQNDQIKEMQTIIRDKTTDQSDFVFCADRLIRLIVEESLNELPFSPQTIVTPTGELYNGLKFAKGNCGVSIIRSGEAMEKGLRECCRSIRIGKILIQSDADSHEARVLYAKLVPDIAFRYVLLMYPIMSTGATVIKAMDVLHEYDVETKNVILLTLFCTPQSLKLIARVLPELTIITSEIHSSPPTHFGQKYFGTDC